MYSLSGNEDINTEYSWIAENISENEIIWNDVTFWISSSE